MRTRNWLASILGGYLAVAGGASAQDQVPPFPQYGPGNPDALGMLPSPYNVNYGRIPPGTPAPPGVATMGIPEGANPWPNVSPYMGPAVDSHRHEDGLWFNKQYNGGRKFHFSVDAIFGRTQVNSGTGIGASGINNIRPFLPPGTPLPSDHNQPFVETVLNVADDMPNRSLSAAGGGGGNAGQNGDLPIFETQHLGRLKDNLGSGGLRSTWGWETPDGSGLQITGMWQDRAQTNLLLGTGIDYNPDFSVFPDYDEQNIRALAGIPLGGRNTDGSLFDPDEDNLYGVVQPFDLFYRIRYQTESIGAGIDWFGSPVYEKKSLLIRPVAAGRLVRLTERFHFDGADSGMGYTIQPAAANANNNAGSGNIPRSPLVFEPGFSTPDVMYSEVVSRVQSYLAGPEVGLRFDLGGEMFRITSQSKVGVLVNTARRDLAGYNIGDAIYVSGGRATPIMPRNNADLTRFQSDEKTTSVSPMFEQMISLRTKPFGMVPYLNRARLLNEAEFNFGYTWLVIGQVYRPADTINWDSYPTNPSLNDKKTNYVNGFYNLGLEWTY